MKTGFKDLDKLIDLQDPQLILLSGTYNIDEFSGDIANNIMLKQNINGINNVLEIVNSKKEYLIKRILVNESNVNYNKWTLKDQYTDEELQQIGQATVNLIETTKTLPTIIEQDVNNLSLKDVKKLVVNYANANADREVIDTLIILDIFPLTSNYKKKSKSEIIKFIKDMKKISSKLRCPIIIVYTADIINYFERGANHYITKNELYCIDKINKYVDKFIILNANKKTGSLSIFDVDVYDNRDKLGNCKLKYNHIYRKFEDYKE